MHKCNISVKQLIILLGKYFYDSYPPSPALSCNYCTIYKNILSPYNHLKIKICFMFNT